MFKNIYLKLTLFYVLIIMIISFIFSISLYQLSVREISRGLGPEAKIFRFLEKQNLSSDLEIFRLTQIKESKDHIKLNLIYFNLLILVLSSFACYFLAKSTLQPIRDAMLAQIRFTADASHELRTPLAAMKTEIEVLLRDKNINLNKLKKLLKSNLEEIDKLEKLSASLLKLARLDKKPQNNFEKISISEPIITAYEKVATLAKNKSISFKNKLKEFEVLADKQSLTDLFVIILDNSIKYTHKKSNIYIETSKIKQRVVVKIKDSGIGINETDLPHIFERFYRADNSRSKGNTPGFGLGLSIAKEIVDLHKGTIEVKSEINKGTEFIISLPTPTK